MPKARAQGDQLFLMCDDVAETVTELADKGVESAKPVSDER
ncbi:hypothetical protein [Streptomyces sp. 2A115]